MVAASMFKKLWKKGAASAGGGKSSGERSSTSPHESADSSRVAPMPVPTLLLSSNLDRLADEKAKGVPLQKSGELAGPDVRRNRKKLVLDTTETVDLWDLMHGLEEDEEADNWLGKHSPGGPLPDLNAPPNRQEITDIVRSALKKVLDPERGKEFQNGRGGKDFVEKVLPLSEVLPLSRQSSRSSLKSPGDSSDGGFRSRDHSLDSGFNTAGAGSEQRSSGGSVQSISPKGLSVSEVLAPHSNAGKTDVWTSQLPLSRSTGNLVELEFASPSGPVSPATLRRHFTFPLEDAGEKAHGRKALSLNCSGEAAGGLLVKEGFSGELSGKALGLRWIKVRGEVSKTQDDISVRSGDPWSSLGVGTTKGQRKDVSSGVRKALPAVQVASPGVQLPQSAGLGLRPARLIEKVAWRGDEDRSSPHFVSRAAEHLLHVLRQGRVGQGEESKAVAATHVNLVADKALDGKGAVVDGGRVMRAECERGEDEGLGGSKNERGQGEKAASAEKEKQGALRLEDAADLDEIARLRRISAEVSLEVSDSPNDEVRRRRDAREAEDDTSEASFAFKVLRTLSDDVFGSPISAAGPLFDPEMLASFEEDLQTMSEEEWQAHRASSEERVSVLGRSPSGALETSSGVREEDGTSTNLWTDRMRGQQESGAGARESGGQRSPVSGSESISGGGAEKMKSEGGGRCQVSTGGLSREASMDDGGLEEVMSEVEDFLSRLEQNASTSWERGVQRSLSSGGGNLCDGVPGVASGDEASGAVKDRLQLTGQVTGVPKSGSGVVGRSPKGSPRGRALGKPPLSPRRTPKSSPPVSPGKSTPSLLQNPNAPPRGEDRVVVYTTSVRAVRKTFEECNRVRGVFSGHGVHVDERDISMHAEFRDELRTLMGGPAQVPQVFVRGKHIGGVEELQRLNDSRELLPLLEGFERHRRRGACDSCGGVRFHLCRTCNGSCKLVSESGPDGTVRCPNCNENGLRLCAVCA